MSSELVSLEKSDLFSIAELAKDKRRHFDVGMLPIGDNIFKLIRKEGIYLICSPVEIDISRDNNFSAIYVRLPESFNGMSFIGLNTADYIDKQIFALAHELYHHYEKSPLHVSRLSDDELNLRELRANRFAAEFLLPTEKLETEIKDVNNGDSELKHWKPLALLRLIARLQCEYKLPYKAIVKRLLEIRSIDNGQYEDLLVQEARDKNSSYFHIGCSTNEEVFKMLNTKTFKSGVDANELEKILLNYEDNIISISELAETLAIFNKTLSDFGLEEEVDKKDLEELNDYL